MEGDDNSGGFPLLPKIIFHFAVVYVRQPGVIVVKVIM
jgi:hypothetical protein